MAKEKKFVQAITSRDEDFAQWYTDVVREAKLCDYSSVKAVSYTHLGLGNQEQTEVVTILEKSEYAKLLAFIHETDQSAFVTVSTVSEVIGEWNKHKKNRLRKAE